MSDKLNDMIKTSLASIKDIVSCDTVMGTPMHMPQGTTIIPVSKVTVGYASGGLDYFSKNLPAEKVTPTDKPLGFGGGGGTGVNVVPVGFLVVEKDGTVEFLSIDAANHVPTAVSILDTVLDFAERSPEIVERVKNIFAGSSKNKEEESLVPTEEATTETATENNAQ